LFDTQTDLFTGAIQEHVRVGMPRRLRSLTQTPVRFWLPLP
jgi:hypothetical protein